MVGLWISVVVKRLVTSIVGARIDCYAAGDFCSYVALFLTSTVLIIIVTVCCKYWLFRIYTFSSSIRVICLHVM